MNPDLKRVFFILSFLVATVSFGQDIHFSQFYLNPVYLNPGLTGNFDGQMRFSFNQRSQWRSVSRPYNTVAFAAESKMGWVLPAMYHGLSFFHDVAGDGNFRTTEISLSTAYELYLDHDSVHSVTPAVQLSFNHRNIDFTKFNFDNQFNGYVYDPGLPTGEVMTQNSRAGFNASVGAIYAFRPEPKKEIVGGFGFFNIPQIKQSFYGDDGIRRDRRLLIHARGNYPINDKWDVQPAGFAQFQGEFKEIVVGTNVRYTMKDYRSEYLAPYAGIYFRGRDALYAVAGLYYNDWIAGVSYDFNISQLVPASRVRGGLEFAVQYVLHLFKPKVIQYKVCPDYL